MFHLSPRSWARACLWNERVMEVMDVVVYFINAEGLSRHPEVEGCVFISILCFHDNPQLASPYKP